MIAIKSLRNPDKGIAIISYLKWNFKKETVDPPCYSSSAVQDDFRKKIWECCMKNESSDEGAEIVKMLAPLTYDLNTPNIWGETPNLFGSTLWTYRNCQNLGPKDRHT